MGNLAITGGKPLRTKPFHGWPIWDDTEREALSRVLESGKWGSLHGDEVRQFEKEFAAFHDVPAAVAVTSGDAALRIVYRIMGLKEGDEVIAPAYTFTGTVVPAIDCGASIRFADVLPETYNIDPASIEENITEKTKMILVVHFAGLPAKMKEIQAIADRHNLSIVEDAAQAWGSMRYGKSVGTFAEFAAFSFQSSKNITAGEGGIITIRDEQKRDEVMSFSNNGRRQSGKWYEHYDKAGNYRMTEFQGALLRAQFSRYPEQMQLREKRAAFLREELAKIEGITPLIRPEEVDRCSNHIFIFKYDKTKFGSVPKEKFIEALQKEGIPALTGYVLPLHKQPVMADLGNYEDLIMPVSERACTDEAIWLRHSLLLDSEQDLQDIGLAIKKIQDNYREFTQ